MTLTRPEISGTEAAGEVRKPTLVTKVSAAEISSHYASLRFEGTSYRTPAERESDPLPVLALLALIRSRGLTDAPDDPDEAWEISATVQSLADDQWQALDRAGGNAEGQ